jgi:hypothetical protein
MWWTDGTALHSHDTVQPLWTYGEETMKNKSLSRLVVEYMRRSMIGNERQALALFYGYMTSHLGNHVDLIDVILTGTQSSGKTMLQKMIRKTLPQDMCAEYSGGSPKAFIYDEELQKADYYFFSELQKFSSEWVEYLKSLSGDDPEFVYKVTIRLERGFSTQTIRLKKKPFSITSAQEMKDAELRSRLLQIPMDENKLLNEAVIKWQLGADVVEYKGVEYCRDNVRKFTQSVREVVEQIHALENTKSIPKVIIPDVYMDSIATMIDANRTNSRRHAKIIAILLKISRLLDFVYLEMNPLEDIPEKLECRAQDMMNLLTLQPILLTTIMEMDNRAKLIYDIIDRYEHVTRADIHKYLSETLTSSLGVSKIGSICGDMAEMGIIEESKKDNKYRYRTTGAMKVFGIRAEIDDLLGHDKSPVTDPLTGQEYANIKEALEDIAEKNKEQLVMVRKQRGVDEFA